MPNSQGRYGSSVMPPTPLFCVPDQLGPDEESLPELLCRTISTALLSWLHFSLDLDSSATFSTYST
jgi:hypothetical protein